MPVAGLRWRCVGGKTRGFGGVFGADSLRGELGGQRLLRRRAARRRRGMCVPLCGPKHWFGSVCTRSTSCTSLRYILCVPLHVFRQRFYPASTSKISLPPPLSLLPSRPLNCSRRGERGQQTRRNGEMEYRMHTTIQWRLHVVLRLDDIIPVYTQHLSTRPVHDSAPLSSTASSAFSAALR